MSEIVFRRLSRAALVAAALSVFPGSVHAQTPQSQPQAPTAPKPDASQSRLGPSPQLGRWIDLQNATLNLRYRFIDTSAGVVTTNQLQHRETLRARVKFDKSAAYTLNMGVFTGARFTSGWDNTRWGIAGSQKNLAFKALYFSASPVKGIEGQYGGLYIVRGESTELTTYDEDGYVIGERISLRRPKQLFFDEISATVGYLTSNAREIAFSKRVKYLNDTPNYRHFLADKKISSRVAASTDFTNFAGVHTWRQAVNVKARELRFVDRVIFENYERTNHSKDYGFALTLDKALNQKLSINWGYASIDPQYGGINSDRFNIGNRGFVMATCNISPEFQASYFITTAIGQNGPLPQRTLMNLVFTFNVLPELRRTGLF